MSDLPRVTAEHKERRREAILSAAMSVFINKGYQVATINDIAQEASLSVGAIYRYFSTKDELMLALVKERLSRAPELFARMAGRAGDPWQRLERCVDLFTTALRIRHPGTGRLLLVSLAEAVQDGGVRAGLHRRFRGLVDYLAEIIADGIAQGLFRPDADPRGLASLLVATADGVAVYWVTGTPEIDLDVMRSTILSMLRSDLLMKKE